MQSSKKWILVTTIVTIVLALAIVAMVYVVDPFNFLGWSGAPRFYNSATRFIPGMVKHYNADAYLIGSSMIQNTDMDSFRQHGYSRPAKLEKSGITMNENLLVLRLISESWSDADIYLNMDYRNFLVVDELDFSSDVMPDWMYSPTKLDNWRYFFDYAVWYRYMPVTVGMYVLEKALGSLPSIFTQVASPDDFGYWADAFSPSDFGVEALSKARQTGTGGVSSVGSNIDMDNVYAIVDEWMGYFAKYTENSGKVTVMLPPWSLLFWHDEKNNGTFDEMMLLRSYLAEKFLELGVEVIDFQSVPDVADLSNYKDTTHYGLAVQEKYTDAFLSGGNIHSVEDMEESSEKIEEMLAVFEKENADWI